MSPYDEFEPTGEDVVIDVAAFDAKISGSPDYFDDELGYPSFDDEEIDALFAALKHPEAEAEFGNLGRLLGEVRSSLFDRGDVAISAELAEYISVDDTMLTLPVYNGAELAREVGLVDVDEMLRVFSTADEDTPSAHDEAPNRIHRVLAGAALAMAVVGGLVGAQHLRPATDDTVAGLLSDSAASDSSQSDEYGEAVGSEDQNGQTPESLWSGVLRGALYGGLMVGDGDEPADSSSAVASEWMSAGSGSVGRDASDSDNASPGKTRRSGDSSNNDTGRSGARDTAPGAKSSSGTDGFKAGASTGLPTKGSDDKPWSTGAAKNTELPPAAAKNTGEPSAAAKNTEQPSAAAKNTEQPTAAAKNTEQPTAAAKNTEQPTAATENTPSSTGGPKTTAPPTAAMENTSPSTDETSTNPPADTAPPEVTAPPESTAPPEVTAPEVTAPPENTAPPEVTAPEVTAPPDTGSPDIQTEGATLDTPSGGESDDVLLTTEANTDASGTGDSGSLSGEDLEPVLVPPPPVPPYVPSTLEPQPEEQSNYIEAMGSGAGSPPAPPQPSGSGATSAPEIGETIVVTDPPTP